MASIVISEEQISVVYSSPRSDQLNQSSCGADDEHLEPRRNSWITGVADRDRGGQSLHPPAILPERAFAGFLIFRDEAADLAVGVDADIRPAGAVVEAEGLAEIAAEIGALAFFDIVEAGEWGEALFLAFGGGWCGGEGGGDEEGGEGRCGGAPWGWLIVGCHWGLSGLAFLERLLVACGHPHPTLPLKGEGF